MATGETQTYTVDTQVQTETMPDNLTPDEQDSLKIGEEITQQEDQLLAGKYKSAQELEKAYKELESKLGQQQTETTETTEQVEPEPESKPAQLSDNAALITSASDEYYSNDGKLSSETIEKFKGMSSEDLVNAYLEVTKSPDWSTKPPEQIAEVSESQINNIKDSVGGQEAYTNMIAWAAQNLDAKSISAFDDVMNRGSIDAINFAVAGLKSQYQNAVGFEGKMVQGKPPQTNTDVFRSQAELVAAMNDRRYDRDPAYRQDVIQKLERSDNLNF
tara:strand:+ start:664 stop:1485 length:822 start_codon:yes stop_codon:yes gene_type:complete